MIGGAPVVRAERVFFFGGGGGCWNNNKATLEQRMVFAGPEGLVPADMRRGCNAALMLANCLRCWSSIKAAVR